MYTPQLPGSPRAAQPGLHCGLLLPGSSVTKPLILSSASTPAGAAHGGHDRRARGGGCGCGPPAACPAAVRRRLGAPALGRHRRVVPAALDARLGAPCTSLVAQVPTHYDGSAACLRSVTNCRGCMCSSVSADWIRYGRTLLTACPSRSEVGSHPSLQRGLNIGGYNRYNDSELYVAPPPPLQGFVSSTGYRLTAADAAAEAGDSAAAAPARPPPAVAPRYTAKQRAQVHSPADAVSNRRCHMPA